MKAIHLCGGDLREVPDDSDCPNNDQHTPMPRGYVDRAEWAGRQIRAGRTQVRCPGCDLLVIWIPATEE